MYKEGTKNVQGGNKECTRRGQRMYKEGQRMYKEWTGGLTVEGRPQLEYGWIS